MVIGPFWCEAKTSWLRFVSDETNRFHAEIVIENIWTTDAQETFWVVTDYDLAEGDDLGNRAFELHEGVVYRTHFSQPPNRDIIFEHYVGQEFKQYKPKKGYVPFQNQTKECLYKDNVPSKDTLPPTPEEILQKAEQRQKQWDEWDVLERRKHLVTTLENPLGFNDQFYQYMETEISKLFKDKRNTPEEYRQQLLDCFPHIASVAGKTEVDTELQIPVPERPGFLDHKKQFVKNLLTAEIKAVSDEFSLPPIVQPEEHQDGQQQPPKANMNQIEQAVWNARNAYATWYNNKPTCSQFLSLLFTPPPENRALHRGNEGVFTRLRHGDDGQTTALTFEQNLLGLESEQAQITEINNFLSKNETRYHKHSFASFLLDELKKIEGKPWHGLEPDNRSYRYDKSAVIQAISEPLQSPIPGS